MITQMHRLGRVEIVGILEHATFNPDDVLRARRPSHHLWFLWLLQKSKAARDGSGLF
jgi:hypothetical protein